MPQRPQQPVRIVLPQHGSAASRPAPKAVSTGLSDRPSSGPPSDEEDARSFAATIQNMPLEEARTLTTQRIAAMRLGSSPEAQQAVELQRRYHPSSFGY